MMDGQSSDLGYNHEDVEELKCKLKHNLGDWRQFLVHLYSVLIWQESYHSVVLGSFTTLIFLIIWYLEPTILTTLSLLGIIACLVDYLVPVVCRSLFDPKKWTSSDEDKFDNICNELAVAFLTIAFAWNSWQRFKDERPKIYFAFLLTFLIIFAWVGNVINNLFLTYLCVLLVVMLPGLKHHGILAQYTAKLLLKIGDMFKSQKTKVN